MGISEALASVAVQFIGALGYPSVFILMVLESMVVPMPSEAVMPFAGWLIADGRFGWAGVMAASVAGSLVGSALSYAAGYYGGRPFVRKFGKFFFLNEEHLDKAHRFFERHGAVTVFVCRFVPVIRHLSSIPAGFARMHFGLFLALTMAGAGIWNAFLAYVGTLLQQHWNSIMRYSSLIDIAIVLALLAALALFVARQLRARRAQRP